MSPALKSLIIDTLYAMARQIPWKKVYDRYLYKVIENSLRKLVKRTSNTLDDQMVEHILQQLRFARVNQVPGIKD